MDRLTKDELIEELKSDVLDYSYTIQELGGTIAELNGLLSGKMDEVKDLKSTIADLEASLKEVLNTYIKGE